MEGRNTVASLGLIPVLLLGVACSHHGGGGGGGTPTALDLNSPVIANLRVSFGPACTLPGSEPGLAELVAFDYTDADGNLRGGTLEDTTIAPVGGTIPTTESIPSDGVTITGTTSGTVAAAFCTHFGDNPNFTEQVKVTDATGKVSNVLALNVTRPSGAPLLPRGTDLSIRKSPRI
jgi:hypothetical protein